MVATKAMQLMADYNSLLARKALLLPEAFQIGDNVVATNLVIAVKLNGLRGTVREVLSGGLCFTVDFGLPLGEAFLKPANLVAAPLVPRPAPTPAPPPAPLPPLPDAAGLVKECMAVAEPVGDVYFVHLGEELVGLKSTRAEVTAPFAVSAGGEKVLDIGDLQNLPKNERPRIALLSNVGSFNPVQQSHIATITRGARVLAASYDFVLGGIQFNPVPHVASKCSKDESGTVRRGLLMPTDHRATLAQLALDGYRDTDLPEADALRQGAVSAWITVGGAVHDKVFLLKQAGFRVTTFQVGGSDDTLKYDKFESVRTARHDWGAILSMGRPSKEWFDKRDRDFADKLQDAELWRHVAMRAAGLASAAVLGPEAQPAAPAELAALRDAGFTERHFALQAGLDVVRADLRRKAAALAPLLQAPGAPRKAEALAVVRDSLQAYCEAGVTDKDLADALWDRHRHRAAEAGEEAAFLLEKVKGPICEDVSSSALMRRLFERKQLRTEEERAAFDRTHGRELQEGLGAPALTWFTTDAASPYR